MSDLPGDLGARAGHQGRLRQGAGPGPGRARAARRGVRSDSSCLDPSVDHPCTLHCPCRSAQRETRRRRVLISFAHGFQTPELRALSALCSCRCRRDSARAVRITALVADARRTRRGDDARHVLEASCVLLGAPLPFVDRPRSPRGRVPVRPRARSVHGRHLLPGVREAARDVLSRPSRRCFWLCSRVCRRMRPPPRSCSQRSTSSARCCWSDWRDESGGEIGRKPSGLRRRRESSVGWLDRCAPARCRVRVDAAATCCRRSRS